MTRISTSVLAAIALIATMPQVRGDRVAPAGSASGAAPEDFHFSWEISPLLAKAGCSAADCHGGASGRGGFKLSLFSSDPHADYVALTRELGGRRIDLVDPANSLLLRKPARQGIKHKGGRLLRAEAEDHAYSALLDWVARGAPWSSEDYEPMTHLYFFIENNTARAFAHTLAMASDGPAKQREVTALTRFESTNEAVAEIDENGVISRVGSGETWIIATYGQLTCREPLLVPFAESNEAPRHVEVGDHPIDRIWHERLKELGLQPAERAPEHLLIRRLYLDLAGRPPRPEEVAAFLELPAGSRVETTATALMESPAFAETFGRRLAEWFEIPISERDPKNAAPVNTQLREFFHQAMVRGESLNDLARAVILEPDGQVAWKRLTDPRDRAEYLGRTLLGRRIDCARCHNHPLDRWKQEEHLRFSAFFSDDRPDPDQPAAMMTGRFFEPETGREIEPALLPLGLKPPWEWPKASEPPSRNEQIAWFIVDGAGQEMARNFANRLFETLIGQPLVEATDDHRLSNPAIHEDLLKLLARYLDELEGDARTVIEVIVTSQLYAASSEIEEAPLAGSPALAYMARREARRLTSDDYRRAIREVLGVPVDAPLPAESPLAQQLYLINSGLIQKALATPGNQVEAIHDFVADPSQRLADLYLLVLSRPPSDREREALLPDLENATDSRQALFDLALALLASREFGSVR